MQVIRLRPLCITHGSSHRLGDMRDTDCRSKRPLERLGARDQIIGLFGLYPPFLTGTVNRRVHGTKRTAFCIETRWDGEYGVLHIHLCVLQTRLLSVLSQSHHISPLARAELYRAKIVFCMVAERIADIAYDINEPWQEWQNKSAILMID